MHSEKRTARECWKSLARPLLSLQDGLRKHMQPHMELFSFITCHYIYFCGTTLLAAIIFWGSSTPAHGVRFIDSLFLCVSAMTEAGLNTVNLSELNTWQQIMLFFLIIMGSGVFVSIAVLHVRKKAFEKKLQELAERRRRKSGGRLRTLTFSPLHRKGETTQREDQIASGAVRSRVIHDDHDPEADYQPSVVARRHARTEDDTPNELDGNQTPGGNSDTSEGGHIQFAEITHSPPRTDGVFEPAPPQRRRTFFLNSGVAARGLHNHPRNSRPVTHERGADRAQDQHRQSDSLARINKHFETINGYLGRNSQFHNLSEAERRELGGIEYDAICVLSWLVPVYFVLWQVLGAIGLGAWITINRPGMARTNGLNPFWTGAFFAISAFNNSGMALLDANAVALQKSYYCLLTLSLLILAGYTCFPPFLRLIIWSLKTGTPEAWRTRSSEWQRWHRTLSFILEHPRRVYTNLFPATQTWWLVFSLVLLNGVDWLGFIILNFGNPILDSIPARFRALYGLFQAFAVRAGGFYVVPIPGLYPGLLVLYVLMMYVSAYPVAMTIRSTNVYEERSLGIYADDASRELEKKSETEAEDQDNIIRGIKRTVTLRRAPTSRHTRSRWTDRDFFRQQLRGQLGHDLWWIALAVFLISVTETSQFRRDPVVFSIFNIIFEVISGYGTVGISTGVPGHAYSFSGAWHTASKLILCAVMLRGRHRGLPVAIDRAILLPDQSLAWAEEEDAQKKKKKKRQTGGAQPGVARVRTEASLV